MMKDFGRRGRGRGEGMWVSFFPLAFVEYKVVKWRRGCGLLARKN
jgi:hypothetical protein